MESIYILHEGKITESGTWVAWTEWPICQSHSQVLQNENAGEKKETKKAKKRSLMRKAKMRLVSISSQSWLRRHTDWSSQMVYFRYFKVTTMMQVITQSGATSLLSLASVGDSVLVLHGDSQLHHFANLQFWHERVCGFPSGLVRPRKTPLQWRGFSCTNILAFVAPVPLALAKVFWTQLADST